jgi:hypothetical protein
MRARGARAPARANVKLIFPTTITDKKIHQPSPLFSIFKTKILTSTFL